MRVGHMHPTFIFVGLRMTSTRIEPFPRRPWFDAKGCEKALSLAALASARRGFGAARDIPVLKTGSYCAKAGLTIVGLFNLTILTTQTGWTGVGSSSETPMPTADSSCPVSRSCRNLEEAKQTQWTQPRRQERREERTERHGWIGLLYRYRTRATVFALVVVPSQLTPYLAPVTER